LCVYFVNFRVHFKLSITARTFSAVKLICLLEIKNFRKCYVLLNDRSKANCFTYEKYRVIKKSLCTWWLEYRKLQVMFKVSPASLQTFIDTPHYLAQSECLAADRQGHGDTRLTLTPSVIPNYNYVIMVSDWNCLKYFCVFFVLQSSGEHRLFDHSVYFTTRYS
jgi:hypothetical protein